MPQNNFLKSQLPRKQLSTLPTNKYLLVFESRTIEDSADTSFSRKKIKSLKTFVPLNILKLSKTSKTRARVIVFFSPQRETVLEACSGYCLSSWGSSGKSASSSGDLSPSGSSVARTFLFSLNRPEREIFKLRRLLPDFSSPNLSDPGGSPVSTRTSECWFSPELLVRSK